ncbi:MAG TPA: porin family protein [Allosphingosinicella sp.]|jgi:outer membrane immunogenic protein|nr:porin family protein [Allosphingosinicella sp.]
MKIIVLLAGAALSASLARPAHAADFTGPRVEVHAGWDRIDVDDPSLKLDRGRDGIAYGLGLGYDLALGEKLVAGVEAEFDLSGVDFESVSGNTQVEAEAKRDFAVSARLGARVGEKLLVYAKGGYTNARLAGALVVGGKTGTTRTEFRRNGDGFRLGAGAEIALAGKAYAKTEYRYSDYEGGVARHQLIAGVGLRF